MPESRPFRFKKFSIYQDRCAMKVGTDGVLLGAWAKTSGEERVLDIGTGTGLLALMVAQRNPSAMIDAIEIDEAACWQAAENAAASPWADRIRVQATSLQDYHPDYVYDILICNPPFYTDSPAMAESPRKKARLAETLSPEVLLDCAGKLLKPAGLLQLVLPVREGNSFMRLAETRGWRCLRLTRVRTKATKPVTRWLMAFCAAGHNHTVEEGELTIQYEETHAYTEAFRSLLSDFYVIFN